MHCSYCGKIISFAKFALFKWMQVLYASNDNVGVVLLLIKGGVSERRFDIFFREHEVQILAQMENELWLFCEKSDGTLEPNRKLHPSCCYGY